MLREKTVSMLPTELKFGLFDLLWFGFSLSLLIVTLIFLQDNIHGNEHLLPGFNHTMFNFVVVGHWIMVGVTALDVLLGILYGVGLVVIAKKSNDLDESPSDLTNWRFVQNRKKKIRKKRAEAYRPAAAYQFIEL